MTSNMDEGVARDGTLLNDNLQQTVLLAALTTLGQRRGGNGLDEL